MDYTVILTLAGLGHEEALPAAVLDTFARTRVPELGAAVSQDLERDTLSVAITIDALDAASAVDIARIHVLDVVGTVSAGGTIVGASAEVATDVEAVEA